MSGAESTQRYDILEAIGQIARDKNVNRELIAETIKAGLLSAAKKRFGSSDNILVNIDLNTGNIIMEAVWDVVKEVEDYTHELTLADAKKIDSSAKIGQKIHERLRFEEFGRHAIHSAKQSLIQKVKEAERDRVYEDFRQRINEVVTGIVQQVMHGDIFVNLSRAEAIVPQKYQIRRERYHQGNTIRAIIADVKRDAKGPQIILSRTDPKFLAKLFEIEVPEIYEGVVEIKGVARKAGERSKIAVYSTDPRIDPVGACVGIKGSRVQGIVKELSNERIDIIQFSDDISTYLARALSPAVVKRVDIDRVNGKLIAVVDDDQLSLAIGKSGINAELASQLTGLSVEIISQSQFLQRESDKTKEAGLLIDLEGLGEKTVYNLNNHGINTIKDLAAADVDFLVQIPGIGPKTAEKFISMAETYMNGRIKQTPKNNTVKSVIEQSESAEIINGEPESTQE
ncbi:MAG: transcription termination factor NusA [Candidatus Latescibacterota bacterium]